MAKTDRKSLWESVNNSRQCEEKMLRNTIAGIKQLMELKMLDSLEWVSTFDQPADCLTKKGNKSKADWLLQIASENILKEERKRGKHHISYK